MSKFPTRISAARRNAEALLSRSKKQESTLKLEQEREHDAMAEKTSRRRRAPGPDRRAPIAPDAGGRWTSRC